MEDEHPVPDVLEVERLPGEKDSAALARTLLRPELQAAATLKDYGGSQYNLELAGLIEALQAQTDAVSEGNLRRGEEMLTTQAHILDAIFNNFARRASNAEYMSQLEQYLKLALRAQSQCRATWEAISSIKNPPMVGYVGQANIANGPQQVNNSAGSEAEVQKALENENLQTKLLEKSNVERLDPGAARTSGGADSAMAAVGEINRPKVARG